MSLLLQDNAAVPWTIAATVAGALVAVISILWAVLQQQRKRSDERYDTQIASEEKRRQEEKEADNKRSEIEDQRRDLERTALRLERDAMVGAIKSIGRDTKSGMDRLARAIEAKGIIDAPKARTKRRS